MTTKSDDLSKSKDEHPAEAKAEKKAPESLAAEAVKVNTAKAAEANAPAPIVRQPSIRSTGRA